MTSFDEKPSKTKRKQAMHALQDLGEALVALSTERIAKVPLSDELLEAVLAAKRITAREGRRRQIQYVGRLMRNVDPAPIRAKLDSWRGVSRDAAMIHHASERWRERLLEEERALTEFADRYPGHDLQPLRAVLREAVREREAGVQPPRHYRELFRAVHAVVAGEGGAKSIEEEQHDD
jgi:ribosome-associated protein